MMRMSSRPGTVNAPPIHSCGTAMKKTTSSLVSIAAANQHMGSLFTPQSFACGFAEGAALIVVPL